MIDLSNKVVLVTGGSGGIGAAIVRRCAELGASVVLHDVRVDGRAADIQRELGAERCFLVAGDLGKVGAAQEIWAAGEKWKGRIDVLVNNAGIYEAADIDHEFDAWSKSWARTLQVNLVAPGDFCREALRHYREKGGGIIINLASRAAFRGDDADYMHYAASKGGVVAMTRTIARHFGRQGITAFAVAPGFVRTSLNKDFFDRFGVAAAAESIPLGEVAEPEDIANTIAFLASGLAKHATGTTIDINGASYVR
jgi:NAD(P)-dependent dehydrogenase (short-subunit alcohol dehydrogenase family)